MIPGEREGVKNTNGKRGRDRERQRQREREQIGREGREGMIMSCASDTSSCFYGDQGANRVAQPRTVLLTAAMRVENEV